MPHIHHPLVFAPIEMRCIGGTPELLANAIKREVDLCVIDTLSKERIFEGEALPLIEWRIALLCFRHAIRGKKVLEAERRNIDIGICICHSIGMQQDPSVLVIHAEALPIVSDAHISITPIMNLNGRAIHIGE